MSTKDRNEITSDENTREDKTSSLVTRHSSLIFVTGGARSGKSAFALNLANLMGKKKCYLATAQALDSEMEERIARHKAERGEDWDCVEEPLQVTSRMDQVKGRYDVILFDCLTLWVSNIMHSDEETRYENTREGKPEDLVTRHSSLIEDAKNLISSCKSSGSTIIVVSNEVGLGIVPDNALARQFRDLAGTANQLFAKAADEAYFVVSGIPMKLK